MFQQGVSKNVTVRLLEIRFKARNCIREPGARDIFLNTKLSSVDDIG
jgi:hypothetical protein